MLRPGSLYRKPTRTESSRIEFTDVSAENYLVQWYIGLLSSTVDCCSTGASQLQQGIEGIGSPVTREKSRNSLHFAGQSRSPLERIQVRFTAEY